MEELTKLVSNIALDTKKRNNETFGISCEIAICQLFDITDNIPNSSRGDSIYINAIKPILKKEFDNFITTNKKEHFKLLYTGENKCKIDFIDNNNKSYSIKSNLEKSNKICPQSIGQCTKNTFISKVYNNIISNNNSEITKNDIKKFILENPKKLFILYLKNLFCCNYLVYIKKYDNNYITKIYNCEKIKYKKLKKIIDNNDFSFTKSNDEWQKSTSNTLKIKNKSILFSIGEYQIHKNRNSIVFRFNFTNLLEFLISNNIL
jgi:hypothetical protein